MNGLSPWGTSATTILASPTKTLVDIEIEGTTMAVILKDNELWIRVKLLSKMNLWCRAAFVPTGELELVNLKREKQGATILLTSDMGKFEVEVIFGEHEGLPTLRYITSLTPSMDLFIPFYPRDLVFLTDKGDTTNTKAEIHVSQKGTRSGLLFLTITKPVSSTLLYLQNLTAIGEYNDLTQTSAADCVGGIWPEMGFSLPPATQQSLKSGKKLCIGDAIVILDSRPSTKQPNLHIQFLNMLAAAYLKLPRPATNYQPLPDILQKGLKDLVDSPGCWCQVDGNRYFNAYISDYDTPPEIMVQLAVLLPLLDYTEWSGAQLTVIEDIKKGLPAFYDEKLGTIVRWHPKAEDMLEGEEEQKKPGLMDSWYLHHPLLNLSRLALKGDKTAHKLFLDSINYTIKVAKHFKYKWPVFYKMDTLEVIKAETAEGKGGEKDVAGIYAHVMLQAYELTKEKKYLLEAERAARTLEEYGLEVFYQANNTAFTSGALLRLYKLTKKKIYLELSYQCIAAILTNVQLWDCNYGYGKNFPKFFSLFPLSDAPYTAVYEEQEVFCALHDYLSQAEDVEILPVVKLFLAEYIRYLVDRAPYYYPTILPKDMFEEKPKIGEIDSNLWIALEDLQDGWLKSGTVGQEVYGAGNAFGILPRHFIRVHNEEFMIYVDYPFENVNRSAQGKIKFKVLGDARLTCKLMIVKTSRKKLPAIELIISGSKEKAKGKKVKDGHLSYQISGDQSVEVKWTSER
jgi:hypothetical protein